MANERQVVSDLLELFFSQHDKHNLWETALTIEWFGNAAAVRPLTRALHDGNPDRRHAAARALGWIPNAGRSAAKALVEVLTDKAQPQPVREEAAESLAYLDYAASIPALISVLQERDMRIRFWAVFAIDSLGQRYKEKEHLCAMAIEALEQVLNDDEVAPGDWWSVGREALAMLGHFVPRYRSLAEQEIGMVLQNPHASLEDKRWAESYSRTADTASV